MSYLLFDKLIQISTLHVLHYYVKFVLIRFWEINAHEVLVVDDVWMTEVLRYAVFTIGLLQHIISMFLIRENILEFINKESLKAINCNEVSVALDARAQRLNLSNF